MLPTGSLPSPPSGPFDPELLQAMARERVGEVLQRKWRLDAVLGVGGFGAVYAATHRTGSRVAVKVLHKHLAASAVLRQRFLHEAYVANKVNHPGVVTVLDDDVDDDGVPFMIMELLDGMTVEDWAEESGYRLDTCQVLWLADRLLDVLEVAHAQGVIHRDLKPENLFITRDGRLEVLDFGLARLSELSIPGATTAGIGMGTPSFTSPEQARGEWEGLDGRTDIYSVGATMYALLVGHRPRAHLRDAQALQAAMHLPLMSIAKDDPSLSAGMVALVDTAVAFDRQERFADAAAMRAAVRVQYAACTGHAPLPVEWGGDDMQERITMPTASAPEAPLSALHGRPLEELAAHRVVEVTPATAAGAPPFGPRLTDLVEAEAPAAPVVSRRELAEGHLMRGLARHRSGDLSEAIADYDKAIALVPVHAIAYFNRGVARQAQGNADGALLDYGRAIDRQKGFAEPYYNRAGILRSRGQLARAAADAAKALELFRAYGRNVAIPASLSLLEGIEARR